MLGELFLSSFLLVAANPPQHLTYEDLLKYKCDNGNQTACSKLIQIEEDEEQANFLGERVAAFSVELENKHLMLDAKRPDLEAAYPLVRDDYFQGLQHAGELDALVPAPRLAQCAGHYHNYWINKKLWWPNNEGKPDWESIYVFIVDHYFGFCLKTL